MSLCSSMELMPPCVSSVPSLVIQVASAIAMAWSSPSLHPAMICSKRFLMPHLAKCLPRGVFSSWISLRWPPCLSIMVLMVIPTYWTMHLLQVMRYTMYRDLQVNLFHILYVLPEKLLVKVLPSFILGQVSHFLNLPSTAVSER